MFVGRKYSFLSPGFFKNRRFIHNSSGKPVRVRFAPSPTGELHLGSLRTALFNYLYASKYNGAFILRIEDTDQERLIPGAEQKFEDILSYFGLNFHESPRIGGNFGPYRQSERLPLYRAAADQLIDSGHAYKCFCSTERLDILRKKALSEKVPPRYDLLCRKVTKSEADVRERNGESPVIRFKFAPSQMTFMDTVYGEYSCSWSETDFIILKRDGFPTYHFANVVDDHHMEISDVIRGMEWLLSTPKHLKLYDAFSWNPPQFAHLPLITEDGHRKLSKRNSAAYVKFYTDMGYLPSAVLNFLLRNGSGIRNHDTHKHYSLGEMVESFDEKLIDKSSFMMDLRELDRYGKLAFSGADFNILLPIIIRQFALLSKEEKESINEELLQENYFNKVIKFLKLNEETFSKLSDLATGDFRFFFMMPKSANKLIEHFPNPVRTSQIMHELINLARLGKMNFEQLKLLANKEEMPVSEITKLIRLAVIDNVSGPPISELANFFGNEFEDRLAGMALKIENATGLAEKQQFI